MERRTGTFAVTHADEETAVLQDPASGQVHPLAEHPDLEPGEVVEATVEPTDGLEAAWRVVDVAERRSVVVGRSEERPTRRAFEAVAVEDPGDLTRIERAGEGELHVISVPEADTESAAQDVLADEKALLLRAARLGVGRVEVRADAGVVSVRYLP